MLPLREAKSKPQGFQVSDRAEHTHQLDYSIERTPVKKNWLQPKTILNFHPTLLQTAATLFSLHSAPWTKQVYLAKSPLADLKTQF